MSINIVTFNGHLGMDPELRYTPSGTAVCNLRVAISEVRGSGEERTKHTHWVNVTVWEKQADACAQYLKKGSHVIVAGRLNYREWQADDGSKRSMLEVTADRVEFLDGAPKEGGGRREERDDQQGPQPREFKKAGNSGGRPPAGARF